MNSARLKSMRIRVDAMKGIPYTNQAHKDRALLLDAVERTLAVLTDPDESWTAMVNGEEGKAVFVADIRDAITAALKEQP